MIYGSIISEIKDCRKIVKVANHGALLTDTQYYKILSWAKDPKTLNTIQDLTDKGKTVESLNKNELLNAVDHKGNLSVLKDKTNVYFPRWLCHLLGIRHRCSHAVIITLNGFIITQRRSRKKDVSPEAFDIAVGGHVKGNSTFEDALFSEMNEELGIQKCDISKITEVDLYESYDSYPEKNFYSVEARKVFEVLLSKGSFDKIRFTDNEVAGIYLCDKNEIKSLLEKDNIASGLRYSLPRYLDWKNSSKFFKSNILVDI